jgi:hypothetical protein
MAGKEAEELKSAMDQAEWSWILPHFQRDAVIVVSQTLDLLDVAEKIAADHSEQVKKWIEQGVLAKPTLEQSSLWGEQPTKRFLTLVVQPYVLIQELILH